MSAQAGVWNFDGQPAKHEFLARISRAIAQYGPDGENAYLNGPVGMLYRPFHTTLESRLERQPHVSARGNVITWDGRLDNRDELMPELWDDRAEDRPDVVISIAALERWGTECFSKLMGDWALVFWDQQEQTLILARDYMGIRRLYYYPRPERVIWCSHLAPLVLSGDQFTLCDEYIAGYLSTCPEAHLTPYREVHSVPPGKFVRIQNGRATIHRYWAFNPRLKTRYRTDAEYEEHFRVVFRQAVRRRLRSDSPVLAELSGGLDSSSIVCMADDILAKEGAETSSVDTFSFYDLNEPNEDDFSYFTKVEGKRGKSGLHADLGRSGVSFSVKYPTFVAAPGFGEREELKAARTAIMRHGKYRVVLSGTGGDELLGQAFDSRVQLADLLVRLRAVELARQLMSWSLELRRPWIQLFFQTLMQLLPTPMRVRMTRAAKDQPWINGKFASKHGLSVRQLGTWERSWFWLPSTRDSAQTLATLSRQMTYFQPSPGDKSYPYLDRDLVEFLTGIPTDQLLRPGQRRSLMRRALVDLLPPEVLSRRTKSGAGRCFVVALEKHWNQLESIIRSPVTSHLGYINEVGFRTALMATKNGHVSPHLLQLLRGLSLELWLRDALERGVISIRSRVPLNAGTDLIQVRA